MDATETSLSHLQAEMLRQILNGGNGQVASTLEMMTGSAPADLEIKTSMVKLGEVPSRVGVGPLNTVQAAIEGDIVGDFLFLQTGREFSSLKKALEPVIGGPVSTVQHATDYMVPDWLENRRQQPNFESRLKDAVEELVNVLFGAYLTNIYTRCNMATLQGLPVSTLPDLDQVVLKGLLKSYTQRIDRAFLVEVSGGFNGEAIRFHLLMFAEPEGLREMLAALHH